MMNFTINNFILILFTLLTGSVSLYTVSLFPGSKLLFLIFCFLSNFYFYISFTKNKIFFETFFSTFLWLGFWLKINARLSLFGGSYHEPTGSFNGSGAQYNEALYPLIAGYTAIILVALIRRMIFNYTDKKPVIVNSLENSVLYFHKHRKPILILFTFTVFLVGATNAYFNIYQRGIIPIGIPFIIYGIYAWLILFGLSAFAGLILQLDLKKNNSPYLSTLRFIFEAFISNTSLLSRGMVLNGSAGLFGVLNHLHLHSIKTNMKYIITGTAFFVLLFALSIHSVTTMRKFAFGEKNGYVNDSKLGSAKETKKRVGMLMIDRWVGIEGLLAVSSYESKGIYLLKQAWDEKLREQKLSLYDRTFINSSYKTSDFSKNHFVSIPGPIAFFNYSDSALIVFLGLFILTILGSAYDYIIFSFSGASLVVTSILSQVIAYRFAHIGYVIKQSYQLLGTLLITLFIFYIIEKSLAFLTKKTKDNEYELSL